MKTEKLGKKQEEGRTKEERERRKKKEEGKKKKAGESRRKQKDKGRRTEAERQRRIFLFGHCSGREFKHIALPLGKERRPTRGAD